MIYNRNNLDKSTSPYLRQHSDNPVHWQEWSEEVIKLAQEDDKPILVSIGYSTCHWCHVMAKEAFSDAEISSFLNENFISIKVDREQRPDIDQYMMQFLIENVGHAGWPLNVFLTPDLRPIFGLTYAPIEAKHGIPPFIEILRKAIAYYKGNPDGPREFSTPKAQFESIPEGQVLELIQRNYDSEYGGYGTGTKFPPYNTILYLVHWYVFSKSAVAKQLYEADLDIMARRGLHDHLQGGFFRYCTDREWTIPHFEKMLYDQAMLLWAYSTGYKASIKPEYKRVAHKIAKCLEETFEQEGLFYSAHDADTDHVEGATYVWTQMELKKLLSPDYYRDIAKTYDITKDGNYEGSNHLIRRRDKAVKSAEDELLRIRKQRPQPFTDRKFITSWNALTGIGLLMAYRHTGYKKGLEKAKMVLDRLLERHFKDGNLFHSSIDGIVRQDEFLEDYASTLLLATYLFEETGEYRDIVGELAESMLRKFKTETWLEGSNPDFKQVTAMNVDQPLPSSYALAEYALLRKKILFGEEYEGFIYSQPIMSDFLNKVSLLANGRFHVVHSPEAIGWDKLPLNTMQVRSERLEDCFDYRCVKYESIIEMIKKIPETERFEGEASPVTEFFTRLNS